MATEEKGKSDFEKVASKNQSVVGDLIDLLKANKKWWLVPILLFMLLFGGLMLLSGTAVAPFIYTLF